MVFYVRIKHILSDVFSSSIFFLFFFYFLLIQSKKKRCWAPMIARFKEKKIEKYMSLTNFILLRIKQMKNKNVM